MPKVTDIAQLEAIYGAPAKASLIKVANHVTPLSAKWIAASRLCVIATVGSDGTDASPRGDDGPVVRIADPKTLLIPDWRGNNRMDTLRNIVADGRISLLFLVQGVNVCLRVNGTAEVHLDADLINQFEDKGQAPRSVVVVHVAEVYCQCARAPMRAGTWNGENHGAGLPTVGDFLNEAETGFDGVTYDAARGARAAKTMW
jgi:PPOX class probable FMN-dependent enzyme